MQAKGLYEQARVEFEAVLTHQRDTLGDTHPSTLIIRHERAGLLHALGEVRQAHDEYEIVLAHRRGTLGDTHPSTLAIQESLADLRQPRADD